MSETFGKILVVDDDEDVLQAARLLLKQHFSMVHTEKKPELIPALLENENYDVILLDMNFTVDRSSGQEGFHWLSRILEIDPTIVVVLITAYGDVEMAVRAIKEGATDFVIKPWQNEKLVATINSALNLGLSRRQTQSLMSRQKMLSADLDQPFHEIVGHSAAMQKVFTLINKVAATDANVLILGENGTGKELVARAIHRQSLRNNQVFINVDLGAITETLFESELFGHAKGAFTDAKESRAGRFEAASGGTLFLDEITNLSPTLQAKLLSVLQNREVTRLGTNKPIPVDIRLICATNAEIYELVAKQNFRQDLLYRINTVEIKLPPLRERPEDIAVLVDHFVKEYSLKYKKTIRGISPEAQAKLQKSEFPGNIRELQHTVERAVIMSEGDILMPTDFFIYPKELKEGDVKFANLNLEDVERTVIRKAMHKHEGNISQAARELGLTRASLYRRIEKYGI